MGDPGVPADHYTPRRPKPGHHRNASQQLARHLAACQFDIQPMVKLYGTAFGLSENDLDTAAKQYDELLASYAP